MRRAVLVLVTLLTPAAATAQRSGSTIPTDRILQSIGAREGTTVCEIGAGDGELTIAAARVVGPGGRIYASELGEERLKTLRAKVAESGLAQITVVAGAADGTNFPDAGCDALFLRNVYHHFLDPAVMGTSIAMALKPGARVAVVDFRPTGKEADAPADRARNNTHGVSAQSVTREMTAAGLVPVRSEQGAQRWFMVVLSRPAAQ